MKHPNIGWRTEGKCSSECLCHRSRGWWRAIDEEGGCWVWHTAAKCSSAKWVFIEQSFSMSRKMAHSSHFTMPHFKGSVMDVRYHFIYKSFHSRAWNKYIHNAVHSSLALLTGKQFLGSCHCGAGTLTTLYYSTQCVDDASRQHHLTLLLPPPLLLTLVNLLFLSHLSFMKLLIHFTSFIFYFYLFIQDCARNNSWGRGRGRRRGEGSRRNKSSSSGNLHCGAVSSCQ